jgi:iron complex transport system substrate-binding protein
VHVPELRILSLLSSGTEIVHALGLGDFQIGRSHECDYPPSVLGLPICSRPSFPVSGPSDEIDRLVKNRVAAALSIYDLDSERIRELRPTHIITQTQCKVCAVSLEDVERITREGLATGAVIISLEPYALADVWNDIRRVASGCGRAEAADQLVARLKGQLSEIQKLASRASLHPSVGAIEWLEPLMAGGNWVPELIQMAHGRNQFGVAGEHSPWVTWDEIVAADPDVLVALPCGFDLARTRHEMHWLEGRPGWRHLRAVENGNVFVCDGNQFMNRPGPRLVESLRIFAEMIHPELFAPTLEGVGWERHAAGGS